MILISVYDKKSSSYHPPLSYDHVSQCIRAYIGFARSKPEAAQIQFSEDFDLYEVGEFNVDSGLIEATVPPSYIESMAHIVAQARKEAVNV